MLRQAGTVLLALVALAVVMAVPASAHRLKVFATVEDDVVSGYGFFVGGGRPQGAAVIVRDEQGRELWRGETDAEGRFSLRPGKPAALTVIIDARDGHIAEARIAAERFAGAPATPAAGLAAVETASPDPRAETAAATPDPQDLVPLIERAVDKAVARQIRPLLEAYEGASGAIRFNDIMGGIGMIVGLAGMGMWAASRRRRGPGDSG